MNKVLWLMISFILFTTLIAEVVNVDLDINRKFYVEMVYNDNTITRNPLEPFEITFRVYDEKNESVPFFPLNIEILTENANISLNNGTPVRISVDGFTDESGKIRAIITPSNANEIVAKVTSINNGLKSKEFNVKDDNPDLRITGLLEHENGTRYALISNYPSMPNLTFKYVGNDTSQDNIYFRIKSEFERYEIVKGKPYNPLFERYFPSANEWQIAPINSNVTLGNIINNSLSNNVIDKDNFFGGKTILTWKLGPNGTEYQRIFYIKGENPSETSIENYIYSIYTNVPWYLWKILQHESTFLQFNTAGYFGNDNIDFIKSTPNFGYPCGWGLSQYDFKGNGEAIYHLDGTMTGPYKTQTGLVWNWQKNLEKGKVIIDDKINQHNAYFGDLWEKSIKPNPIRVGNYIISSEHTHSNIVSFLDADKIQRYNGGGFLIYETLSNGNKIFKISEKILIQLREHTNYTEKILKTNTTYGQ
jgi:hypothetical protein